jgi:hypothetical protein
MELIRNYLSSDDEDDQQLHLSCPVRSSERGLTTKMYSNPHSALDHVDSSLPRPFYVLSCDFAGDQPRHRYATLS